MPGKGTSEPKRLTLDLTPEMHTELKIGAARAGISMVDLIRQLLAEVLDDPRRFAQAATRAGQARPGRRVD